MVDPAVLALDRLAAGDAVEVRLLHGLKVGEGPPRDPHRHDYHEVIWVRDGCGEHLLDGVPTPVQPSTVTLIGRGQIHQFRAADIRRGAVLRFTDDLLVGDGGLSAPGWMLAGTCGRAIAVPPGGRDSLDAVLQALAAEVSRPPDRGSADLERHLVSVILLWLERWYDASRTERRAEDDDDVQLQRRFVQVVERDYTRYHDAQHYAHALAVPAASLSRALTRVTGRSTKELVLDRVMLEARRLLRYTDMPINAVAYEVGFSDQFYFSRAFKRQTGEAPKAFRDRVRGRTA